MKLVLPCELTNPSVNVNVDEETDTPKRRWVHRLHWNVLASLYASILSDVCLLRHSADVLRASVSSTGVLNANN